MKMSALKPCGMNVREEEGEGKNIRKAETVTNTSDQKFTRRQSVKTMISPYFCRWPACRRRRKRRKSRARTQYKANTKIWNSRIKPCTRWGLKMASTCSNDIIAKEDLQNMLISYHITRETRKSNSSNRKIQEKTERTTKTKSCLLPANFFQSGMLQDTNKNCLHTTTTDVTTMRVTHPAKPTVTKTNKLMSATEATTPKLNRCKRFVIKRRKSRQQQQQLDICSQNLVSGDSTKIHECSPYIEQQEQKIQHTCAVALQKGVQNVLTLQCEHSEQKLPLRQQHNIQCLEAAAQQQEILKEIANEQSWRNPIGLQHSDIVTNATTTIQNTIKTTTTTKINAATYVATKTTLDTTTTNCTINEIGTKTIATEIALSNVYAAASTAIDTTTTNVNANAKRLKAPIAKEIDLQAIAIAPTKSSVETNTQSAVTTTTTLKSLQQQQSPHVFRFVVARKSNCRKTFALTSALMQTKQKTKQAYAAATTTTSTRFILARSKTPSTLFGNILSLPVGTLTLHTIVLHCILFASVLVTASTTAATSLAGGNSLLTQQTLHKHLNNSNNNNYNNSDSSGSSNNTIPPSTSTHNYNQRQSQLTMVTTATKITTTVLIATTTTAIPPPARMMDIEVLNGSSSGSSSSFMNDNTANTLKSLSSIVDANFEQEDISQVPIFDFGLPRNITARTSQAEATIKCRVERLDDKSVSWIRKRDLHILTVAAATYTSDKRFQVTSSKDGREWMLHVKSPHVRDSGIYECQVNTEPKISMAFQLNIIEIPADSRAIITGPADLHFKVGSAIILNCHVQQPSKRVIGPIYWYRGEHIITPFEVSEDDIVYTGSSSSRWGGNGISTAQMWPPTLADNEVETDVTATITNVNSYTGTAAAAGRVWNTAHSLTTATAAAAQHDGLTNEITPDFMSRIAMESHLGDTMKSRLRIANAQTTDTGNYTCQPTTANGASVMVHVINDENPAAMQKSNACPTAATTATTKHRRSMLLILLVVVTIIKTLMTRANIIMNKTTETRRMRETLVTTTTATWKSQCELCRQQSNIKEMNCHQQQPERHNKQPNYQHQHQNQQQQRQQQQLQ
ncbi:uncharacterized protein dpr3 [Eurosta solidaginis]|uniref:uncharacterized protein dpr3 n=1 Tax=Eurosta solidaginis TaxID=178769 RepID=UPI00353179B3